MHTIFQKQVALPHEHGAWVFLLSPLVIGIFAGGRAGASTLALFAAALAAFLLRQPMSMAVKVLAGRRAQAYRAPALFWIGIYGLLGIAATAALVREGHASVLYLAVPAVPVMAWHLWLVSRRQERRQRSIEMVASGTLALAAPAALWVGRAHYDPLGWWLWVLVWLQSAASILYAYLRLAQRAMQMPSPASALWALGSTAVAFAGANVAIAMCAGALVPEFRWIFLPYVLQLAEVIWGTFRPAAGWKPTRVGIRQLLVSTAWTVVFIITMRKGI